MPYPRDRKRSHAKAAPAAAIRHIAERNVLSRRFGGIDREIEQIFLSLSPGELERLFQRYGESYGDKPEAYAREAYPRWQSGKVKMSGQTASRLLELLPPYLSPEKRFDLVKQLRSRHFQRQTFRIQSTPATWRADLIKPIQKLVASSGLFQLPEDLKDTASWLADGDTAAAQRLLAAAEQEEAAIRVIYIDEELQRIESMMRDIDTTRRVSHKLRLPQGEITLNVELPARTLLQKLTGWLR